MSKATANLSHLGMGELDVLLLIKSRVGRRLKSAIRSAWLTGNYTALDLDRYQVNELVCMKNNRGYSWLDSLKVSDL